MWFSNIYIFKDPKFWDFSVIQPCFIFYYDIVHILRLFLRKIFSDSRLNLRLFLLCNMVWRWVLLLKFLCCSDISWGYNDRLSVQFFTCFLLSFSIFSAISLEGFTKSSLLCLCPIILCVFTSSTIKHFI